jgi:hypothetical protein
LAFGTNINARTVSCFFFGPHVLDTTNHMSPGDSYVKFQCENLYGYDAVIAELPKYPGLSIEELCNSPVRSYDDPWRSFGFHATEYSVDLKWEPYHRDKNGNLDGSRNPYVTWMSKSYDKNSIMHYWSIVDVKPGVDRDSATVHNVPLIAWRRRGKGYTPPNQVTDENAFVMYAGAMKGPSKCDVAGLKYMYPWEN